jgi:predicted dehydrogenase
MDKVNFGIIGCGYQTQKNMAPAMQKCENTEIIGFYDLNKSKADELASIYKAKAYTKLDDLLADRTVEAVYIATPIATHFELCIKAAEAGKHILCEKSLAMNSEQVNNIITACRNYGVSIFEGFMYQFHDQHNFVREMINQGEIGDPILFQAWFGFPPFSEPNFRMNKDMGGGAILDAGAYVIHSARTFFGYEPVNINSIISYDKDLDIFGSALLDFGHNKIAQLSFGMNNSYKNCYSIWGTKGEITLLKAFSIPEYEIPICRIVNQGLVREYQLKPCNHFIKELEYFCKYHSELQEDELLNQAYAMGKIINTNHKVLK